MLKAERKVQKSERLSGNATIPTAASQPPVVVGGKNISSGALPLICEKITSLKDALRRKENYFFGEKLCGDFL